ncbi:MAG: permease [Deltaproteobacteria bacterium]|nr:permease [Deltaproteobacteria bacterium]
MNLYLHNVWMVLTELAPWLLLGAAIAGLMHGLLPRGFVRKQLSGRSGVLKAVGLGVPLPLCSCGVIPAGLGLKEDGASDGAAVGFVTATPQTGVDSILVSASFLGWPFALWKVLAALVTGVTSGWLTDAATGSVASDEPPPEVSGERPTVRQMVDHGLEMVQMIWGWLLFGVLASAALTTWLPPELFAGLTGAGNLLAFGGVLLFSIPLYVCATASVPIAAALVGAGMPTGAAMVFLMAGPATNVATLGAVKRAFGNRTLGIYLGSLVGGSVVFGLAYEALFGALTLGAVHAHAHAPAWWAQAAAVGLVGAIAWFAWQDARSWLVSRQPAPQSVAGPLVIPVEGMTCNGCSSRLERTLRAAEGVDAATVDLEGKSAEVYGTLDAAQVGEIVMAAGFEVGAT